MGPGSSGSDLKNRTIPSNRVVDPDLDAESKSGRISNFLRWSDPEPTYFKTFMFCAILMNKEKWSTSHYLHTHHLIKALKAWPETYYVHLKFEIFVQALLGPAAGTGFGMTKQDPDTEYKILLPQYFFAVPWRYPK